MEPKVSVITPNGTVLTMSRRSYDLLTAKAKTTYQLLDPTKKVEIPEDVVEIVEQKKKHLSPPPPPPKDPATVVKEEPPELVPVIEPVPVPEPEPIPELPPEPDPEPIPVKEVRTHSKAVLGKVVPIVDIETVPIEKKTPSKIALMAQWRKELKANKIPLDQRIKFNELKKLYNDFKKQENR